MNLGKIRIAVIAMVAISSVGACSGSGAGGGQTSPASSASAAAGSASQAPVAIAEAPVTLRLAIADGPGAPSAPALNHFVTRVAALSGGNVTIVPTFGAGDGTQKGFEEGVAELVKSGDAELGVAASRAWDLSGVTSLQALQAPFLIDNDALAVAVATSEIAQQALDGMSGGVVGLTLWPEDLRHLFAFPACEKDFRSATEVSGSTILIQPSGVTRALLRVLGGIEYSGADRHEDAQACTLQGQEAGLSQLVAIADNTAIAVGNVTLFPKYQVMVANKAAFEGLGEAQRRVLREAAMDTQLGVITEHPDDAALGRAWCAQGGGVVDASTAQMAQYVADTEPIYGQLEQDALTKQLIADIRTLKSRTAPSAGASPCTSTAATPTGAPLPDTTGFVGTMVPDGTYRATITQADLTSRGADAGFAEKNWGVKTFTFANGKVTLDQGEVGGPPCYGTATSVEGKVVRMITTGGGCGFEGDYVWREQGDGIALIVVAMPDGSLPTDRWFFDRVWTRIK